MFIYASPEGKAHCLTGCCTSCAVRVKSGQIRQPEALGISGELKSKVCFNCSEFLKPVN